MPTTTNYDIVVDPSLIESRPNNINSIQSPLQLPQQLELPLSLHLEPSQLLSAASSSAYPSQLPSQASTSSLLQQSPSNNLSLPLLDRIIESKQTKSKPIKKKLTKSQQSQQQQQQQRVLSLEESNANAIATANARTNQILDQAVRFVTATALGVTSTSTANHSNDDDNNFDNLLLESMVSRSNEGVIEEEGIEEGRIENSVSHDLNSFMERLVSNELRLGKGKLVVENSDSILSSAEEGQFQDDNRVIEHQLNQLLSQRTTEEEEGEELEGEEIDYGLKANGKPRKKRGRPKGKKDDPTLKLDGKFRGRPQGTKNVKGYKADILAKAYAEGTLLPPVPKKRFVLLLHLFTLSLNLLMMCPLI